MDFNEILKSIDKRDFKPVYLLQGDENYFIDKIVDKLESSVLSEAEKGFNQTILYGKDVELGQLLATVQRFPMMSEYQVVFLKEAQQMKNLNDLTAYVEKPSPQTIFVIVHRSKRPDGRSKKVDGKSKFYKAIAKNGLVYTAKPIYDNKIPNWIKNILKEKGFQMDPQVPMLLAETYGTNLNFIDKELNKLALNIAPGSKITPELIEKHVGVNREFTMFEYQKALGFRQAEKAFRIAAYFGRNPKAPDLNPVLGSLYNYFNKIYRLHFNRAKSRKDLQKILELQFEFFVDEYQKSSRNYSLLQVEKVMNILLEIDLKSKGVDAPATDEYELFKELTVKVLNT